MINSYKGTRDFLPTDWRILQFIFNNFRKISEKYGFEEYEAPVLCPVELFTEKSGDEIKEQLFWFKDKGDRDVCLRAELTPQLARYVVNYGKGLKKPLKWFSIPRIFRYERPQKGRGREFFQYNADIVGSDSEASLIEIINLGISLLKSVGLTHMDFEICVNSRKIVDSLVPIFKINDPQSFYTLLDKKYKISEEEFKKELDSISEKSEELIKLIKLKNEELVNELKKHDIDVNKIERLFNNVDKKYLSFDISIVRGLAYYTGVVFEAYDKKREFRAIFGGGEYDDLISDFGGKKTPAVGFAIGDMVLLEIMRAKGLVPSFPKEITFIATVGEVMDEAFEIAEILRNKDESVDLNLTSRSLSSQLEYADSKNYETVIIVGEKDLKKKGVVTVKYLKSGKQKEKKIKEL